MSRLRFAEPRVFLILDPASRVATYLFFDGSSSDVPSGPVLLRGLAHTKAANQRKEIRLRLSRGEILSAVARHFGISRSLVILIRGRSDSR